MFALLLADKILLWLCEAFFSLKWAKVALWRLKVTDLPIYVREGLYKITYNILFYE